MSACGDCRYYDTGKCRLNPPVRLPRKFSNDATQSNRVRDESLFWGWPEVKEDDWCGAYYEREVRKS